MIKILSLTYKNYSAGGPFKVSLDYKDILDKSIFYVKLLKIPNNHIINHKCNYPCLKKLILTKHSGMSFVCGNI